MTIHLVYAFDKNTPEIHAPHSITCNLYKFLSSKTDVKYYQWDQHAVADLKPDDIFIGHPHYDTNTIVQRTFREKKCKLMCTIHPLHTAIPSHNMPFDHLAKKADKIFSICGPYWYDTISDTPFAHWKHKIIRLDMAVDGNHFPYLREKFNPIGKRKLLYIGSDLGMKNVGYLVKLMKSMPEVQLHWYGGTGEHNLAKLPNTNVKGWVKLDRGRAQSIINECDVFVNVSTSDANPTTLLESMAWGMITACTKESGYWKDPLFTEIHLNNLKSTMANLTSLLTAPEETLLKRAAAGRKAIETKYTWDRFCNIVWDELKPYVAS